MYFESPVVGSRLWMDHPPNFATGFPMRYDSAA
jgi:hypothetical protein